MPNAFFSFDEPHAWLIRGLVEYGWRDITGGGGVLPPGTPGAFDVGLLVPSMGREGIRLLKHPVADGQRSEDNTYEFEAKITGNAPNIKVVVRCPDCNYLEEFAYDRANPTYCAGYIHQALDAHVAEFTRWRLAGNELSWSQRSGVPDIKGDPCSPDLVRFIQARSRQPDQRFDQGPSQGWWLIGGGASGPSAPIASTGEGGGDPVYLSAQARAQLVALGGSGPSVVRVAALDMVEGPARWLKVAVVLSMGLGVIELVEALLTVYFYGTAELFALVRSAGLSTALLVGGFFATQGVQHYREVRPDKRVWFALLYVGFTPICCIYGFPLALWALVVWLKPAVQAGRI